MFLMLRYVSRVGGLLSEISTHEHIRGGTCTNIRILMCIWMSWMYTSYWIPLRMMLKYLWFIKTFQSNNCYIFMRWWLIGCCCYSVDGGWSLLEFLDIYSIKRNCIVKQIFSGFRVSLILWILKFNWCSYWNAE